MARSKPKEAVVLKSFTVRIPNQLIERLKIHAIRKHTSVQELTARVFETYLQQEEGSGR